MFDKKKDTYLKIANLILIIIATLTLGVAIGNDFYNYNDYMNCNYSPIIHTLNDYDDQAKADYEASCNYARSISEDESKKSMYIGYSIFVACIVCLIIINLSNKKTDK